MRLILAPAKNMRRTPVPGPAPRPPRFLADAARLAADLRARSAWELESLLKIGAPLAWQAFADYQSFDPALPGIPALQSFTGLCYTHLSPQSLGAGALAFAEGRLFILSALYGLLGPSDGILPYRLELQLPYRYEGRTLYRYWGEKPCRALFETGETVINLASAEYARLVIPHLRRGERLIDICFAACRGGRRTVIPTFAKMARGEMARFILQNRIGDPRRLWDFEGQGFAFSPALSNERQYVFLRQG